MQFTKMQGLGNDYLYVFGEVPQNAAELSARLSDRHFGAGSDGMIWICSSKVADFQMRIFNADGSEAKMCGNGIRCVGKYVFDKGYTNKTQLTVQTLSGIKHLSLHIANGTVDTVTVDMGKAVPEEMISVLGADLMPVSMGNPHAVVFVENIANAPLTALGPQIEHHPNFPDGVNVEFVQLLAHNALRMRVWERGSGVTMACGTGACASVVAAVKKGLCPVSKTIAVHLDGGVLEIEVSPEWNVTMTGPAETVYEGEVLL